MLRQTRHKLQQIVDDNDRNKIREFFRQADIFIQRYLIFMRAEKDFTHHLYHKKFTDKVRNHRRRDQQQQADRCRKRRVTGKKILECIEVAHVNQ